MVLFCNELQLQLANNINEIKMRIFNHMATR